MPWLIDNDDGSKASPQLSVGNEVDLGVLHNGNSGLDCVLEGCLVSSQSTPNASKVAVASGSILTNGVLKAYAGVSGASGLFVGSPDSVYARINLIVLNSSGTLALRQGTPASIPLMPALTANDVVLAAVVIPADTDLADPTIDATNLQDKRVIRSQPTTIYKTIAAETTNNTLADIELLNKSGSGVNIPAGMLQPGRSLRCRLGGSYLRNVAAGTTFRLKINYDGNTLYNAVSASVGTATSVRGAWWMTMDLMQQDSTTMSANGKVFFTDLSSSKTNPTNGTGQGWGTGEYVWPFATGEWAITNGADRILRIKFVFSAASTTREIVTEYATLELI